MINTTASVTLQLRKQSTSFASRIMLKSRDLFDKRRILAFAGSLLSRDAYKEWLSQALNVQLKIYDIDYYYEQRARLVPNEEKLLWKRLETELSLDNEFVEAGFSDLKKYGQAESRIHLFDVIDPREFDSIVNLKCADVRMARGLMWSYDCKPPNNKVLKYWELYDQCWELIEDILDIKEDGTDWNFNFWLYSYMSGGDSLNGISAARQLLWRKVAELESIYYRLSVREFGKMGASFQATLFATTLAHRCEQKVIKAISQGKILRFEDHIR